MKIQDKEGCEEPHVTVWRKTTAWRISLRSLRFLDDEPPPRKVPDELTVFIQQNLAQLRTEWDSQHAYNPV